MRKSLSALSLVLASGFVAAPAQAGSYSVDLGGSGVNASFTLTFGSATDSTYPSAYEITGISGSFSDTNSGLNIVNAPIGALVPITHATPEPGNLLAPHDFSRFTVATGLEHGTSLSYSNLYYPHGSPQTATDYPFHGGFLDIYGVLFQIGGGKVVNVWSNGVGPTGALDYGIAVATSSKALDYVGGVSPVPEPGTLWMFGGGMLALLMWRRRSSSR